MTYTPDQVATAIIVEGQTERRTTSPETSHGVITPRGIHIALATAVVETNDRVLANPHVPESENYPNDGDGTDHNSAGEFQQQYQWWGTVAEEMDPRLSAAMFYHHLETMNYNDSSTSPGTFAQRVQQSAFPDRYDQHYAEAVAQYNRLTGKAPPVTTPTDPRLARLQAVRPSFNEFSNWCQKGNKSNWQGRGGTVIDCLLVHTQEGAEDDDNAALDLSNFLISSIDGGNPVSYHDCVRQARDGGVTVVNSVDTDFAAWAVGNSNNRSINRCFAGSDASWTRAQWLTQSRAIDVMAYLMVRDALKYNIDPTHITFGPNYDGKPPPVVSDHRYCTKVLRDGNTHVDVGDGFPADIYGAAVMRYWGIANLDHQPPVPTPAPTPTPDYLKEIWEQLRGPGGKGWTQLGGRSLVDAVAELLKDTPDARQ